MVISSAKYKTIVIVLITVILMQMSGGFYGSRLYSESQDTQVISQDNDANQSEDSNLIGLKYVPLDIPEMVYTYPREIEKGQTCDNITDKVSTQVTGNAKAYIFSVMAEKCSSNDAYVSINGEKTYLSTGDSGCFNRNWAVTFFAESNYQCGAYQGAWTKQFYNNKSNSKTNKFIYEVDDLSKWEDYDQARNSYTGPRNNINSLLFTKNVKVLLYSQKNFCGSSITLTYKNSQYIKETEIDGQKVALYGCANLDNLSLSINNAQSFKILPLDDHKDPAIYSPEHSGVIIAPNNENKVKISWNGIKNGFQDGKTTIAKFYVNLIGYYVPESESNGYKLKFLENDNQLIINNFTRTYELDTKQSNAEGYLIKVTSHNISSDVINVNINEGCFTDLGSSDTKKFGMEFGADVSPTHSEFMFVKSFPDEKIKNILNAEVEVGGWDEISLDSYVKIEVIGAYVKDVEDSYLYRSLPNVQSVSFNRNSSQAVELNYTDEKLSGAKLLLKVTSKIGSSNIGLKVNGVETVELGTSATLYGDGYTPEKVSHSSYAIVANAGEDNNKISLEIEPLVNNSFATEAEDDEFQVEVIGYYFK